MTTRNINAILHAAEYARERGVTVTFEPGWETRSGSKGRDMKVRLISMHHTGGDHTSIAYLRDGDPARGLGTLCNAAVKRDGTVHVISARYTSNEGYNDKAAFDALVDGRAPMDREVKPGADDSPKWSANSESFVIEVIDRGDAWEPHVYRAATVFSAGLVEAYNLSRSNPPLGGHKELTRRKADPWYDMAATRRDVRDILAGAGAQMPAGVTPAPEPVAEPLVATKPLYSNPYVPLEVDGNWGRGTTRALQHCLKEKYNAWGISAPLVVDGLEGKNTYRALQRVLNQEGNYGLIEDGIAGPATKRALQHHLRVRVDGVWGAATNRALQTRLNNNSF